MAIQCHGEFLVSDELCLVHMLHHILPFHLLQAIMLSGPYTLNITRENLSLLLVLEPNMTLLAPASFPSCGVLFHFHYAFSPMSPCSLPSPLHRGVFFYSCDYLSSSHSNKSALKHRGVLSPNIIFSMNIEWDHATYHSRSTPSHTNATVVKHVHLKLVSISTCLTTVVIFSIMLQIIAWCFSPYHLSWITLYNKYTW
ncbi:unnamed protein product [Trypanosoma congolense IL3000]|uniref:WGS project CAEQ00000000 data, annotated contig 423 n=1 Tax=Trypanosoma congolense (strain IL3000) TaxID=1068625 RepID=F9WFU3_TRYCI|nr:unnamed protein product [Trypanosoma congolense IL3000]